MTDPLRRLDAEIAERVYGWKFADLGLLWEDEYGALYDLPEYSTDLALSIGVLEKLRDPDDRGLKWAIDTDCFPSEFEITVEDINNEEKWVMGYSCPLPEAICRHVLHVLGASHDR